MTIEAAGDSAVVLMLRPQTGLGQDVKSSQLSIEPMWRCGKFKMLLEIFCSARS